MLNNKIKKTNAPDSTEKTDSIAQRYNISLNANPYPNLKFSAGSLFELDKSSSDTDGASISSSSTTYYPYADLILGTPLYNAGFGYSRKIDSLSGTGSPESTTINEEYHAVFGWKPEGFPSTSIRLTRTNQFDADRTTTNTTTDYASIGLRYAPAKGLDFRYQTTYIDTRDEISNLESSTLSNNGAASYSRTFFNQRVSLYSSYNFTRVDSETLASGTGGQIDTPVPAFSGLSNYSAPDVNSVTASAPDQNAVNPSLINGDFTASAGVNLGVVPFGSDPTKLWSMGLDFGLGNNSETNTLLIWVDRELPPAIAGSFTWRIFVRGSENDSWVPGPSVSSVTFGSSLNSAGQISFRLKLQFSNVTTRFIKVVVNTLDQSLALANPSFSNPGQINVTELQAFISVPVQQAKTSLSSTSHLYNMDVKTRILNTPALYHSFSFLFATASASGSTRYSISNNLSLNHKLSRIFTVLANVALEELKSASTQGSSLTYNATLKANPLTGLDNTLMYSGRIESSNESSTSTNSIFLHNTAQPYRGISLSLAGGVSESTSSTGGTSESLQFIAGASVTPMKAWNINLTYSRSRTATSGGAVPSAVTSSQTGTLSTSYRPFPTLYLVVTFGMTGQDNAQTQYTQNYGVNWSPFSEGDLQFNFAYNESIDTRTDTKNRSLSPSISWRITSRTLLDVSYPIFFSESNTQSSKTTIFNATLRTSF